MLREAGEIHFSDKRGETPTEAFEDGDIDDRKTAPTVKQLMLLAVIKLADHAESPITRLLRDGLRVSRLHRKGVLVVRIRAR